MGLKRISARTKFDSKKVLGQQYYLVKKNFDQQKFGQNILDQKKIYLIDIIVKQNNFWSKKTIFGKKNRLQENVVSEGKLLITKFIYGWKKMVVRKNFLLKFFLDTIIIIQVLVWKNFAQ